MVMMMTTMVWAEGEETASVIYLGNGSETEKILPQEQDGVTYLFLPSDADFSQLRLAAAEGKIFVGTVADKGYLSSDINGNIVDLTAVFGPMEAGKSYPLRVYEGDVLVQTINVMKSENLPSIHITLQDKDLAYIHKTKNNSAEGQFLYKNGASEMAVELAKFKGRGNSSWTNSGEKRPYNIKLDSKTELIAGAGEAKDWCLLSNNCYDRTGLNNYLAYNLYESLGGAAALKSQTVDLYVNHQYRGTYFLTEKVEIKESRVNIKETEFAVEDEKNTTLVSRGEIAELQAVGFKDKIPTTGKRLTWIKAPENDPVLSAGLQAYQYATKAKVDVPGGFLLEMDATFYKEASWFITRRGTPIVVKEPEFASKEQLQQIAIYVQQFEDALYAESGYNDKGKYYGEYIDMDSFVKRFAVDTVMNNYDMMDKSCYFYIDVEEDGQLGSQVLYAGPAWDYDRCTPEENLFFIFKQYVEPNPLYEGRQEWALQLIKKGDFMQSLTGLTIGALKTEWDKLSAALPDVITQISSSQKMNEILWDNDFAAGANVILDNFAKNRYQYWYGKIFDVAKNILGVRTYYDAANRTLKADIYGAPAHIQWYAIGNDGTKTDLGYSGTSFTLPAGMEAGRFGVAVTGGNPANGCYADSSTITMFSDVMEVGKKIYFMANGRLVDRGECLVAPGGTLTPELWPAVPEKEGYIGTWSVNELTNIMEDTVVEAVYTPIQYSIVYNGNGADKGKTVTSLHTYDAASALNENQFKRTGYWFKGWNTEADGSGKSYRNKAEVLNLTAENGGKIRLYAQWGVLIYHIKYEGLKGAENLNVETYTVEDQVTLSQPVHEKYLFAGWTWKGQTTPVKKVILKESAGNRTFTANWKQVSMSSVKASLRTVKDGYNDIKLTWEKTKGVAGYDVYFKEVSAEEYTFLKSVTGTSVIKKDLKDGVKYKFKIVPYFKSGDKKYVNPTAKTVTRTTLQKVTDVKVVRSGKKVKVSWKNIDGETGYQISKTKKKKATQIKPLTYKTTTGESKKITAVKGKKYFYKVRAYKTIKGKTVYGPWSDVVYH